MSYIDQCFESSVMGEGVPIDRYMVDEDKLIAYVLQLWIGRLETKVVEMQAEIDELKRERCK